MDAIAKFQKRELGLIIGIQDKFSNYEEILGAFSTFFGSTYMYVFVIPCLAAINTRLYRKTLVACIISDFLNLVLKWILSESRPYWWVHETKVYTSLTRPILYQNERTCETSPGSPSGHMMIAASFLFLMLISVEKLIVLKFIKFRRELRYLARGIFAFLLIVTAISRMYFATHFLHQCLFGASLGVCVSETVMFTKFTNKAESMSKRQYFKVGCSMAAIVAAIFWMFKLLTGDPMATVQLAFKYCSDPLFPKPETTVMFSSIRTIAKVCGLLLAAPLYKISGHGAKLNMVKSVPVMIVLTLIQWQLIVYTPKTYKIMIFYAYTFVVYAIFQYLFLTIIPKFCAQKVEKPKEN